MKKLLLALTLIGMMLSCSTPGDVTTVTGTGVPPLDPQKQFFHFNFGSEETWTTVFQKTFSTVVSILAIGYVSRMILNHVINKEEKIKTEPKEMLSRVPSTKLEDLLGERPTELEAVIRMLEKPTAYKAMGISLPTGILFYGPAGTGKTEYARAIANKLKANFFESGSALIGSHYGATSSNIQQLFGEARTSVKDISQSDHSIHAVIFIDEIDSIGSNRNNNPSQSAVYLAQSTNTLLEELTKHKQNKNILFIGATNHKDKLDPSLIRPGRLDKLIEIKKPNTSSRKKSYNIMLLNIILIMNLMISCCWK